MGWDSKSMTPDLGGRPRTPARPHGSIRRALAPLLPVLRHALAPAVRMGRLVRVLTVFGAIAAPVVAYVLGIPAPWLVAGALAFVAALFLRSAVHFYREAHPEFPRHELNLKWLWHTELKDFSGERDVRVLHLRAEFINREPTQPALLVFDLMERRDDLPAHALSHFRGQTLRDTLPSPVKVAPHDRVEGFVVFDGEYSLALTYGGEMDDISLRDRFSIFLRVTDKITGAVIELPVRVGLT